MASEMNVQVCPHPVKNWMQHGQCATGGSAERPENLVSLLTLKNCLQWHNQGFWQNSLGFVAHLGICGER